MRILGPPSASVEVVKLNLHTLNYHPRFEQEMLKPLWEEAVFGGVDPVGVIAQAYKETGGGHYTGKVRPEFYNTCGLKIRHQNLFPGITDGDNPLAHQMFPSWTMGAKAHVQHLCAYAGKPIDTFELVDPRYGYVYGKHWCETFEELGGKWAPAADYGVLVVKLAQTLRKTP